MSGIGKRLFDLGLALVLMIPCGLLMIAVAVAVKLCSKGPVLYWSDRVGRHKTIFAMAKVRTMRVDTPQLATHLMTDPQKYLIRVGSFLRKTSLDEIPQLYNVLTGDMSFVGPRPALFNQDDLVVLRDEEGVNELTPGVTGWAQINGRDDIPIPQKVALDRYYLDHRSFWFDLKILALTALKIVRDPNVSH